MAVRDPDSVDRIVAQWERERPDIDVWPMAVIGRISRLEKAIRPRLAAVFATHDLDDWEFDVLASLRRAGEPFELTPGDLLQATMVTSGTMTHRIDRLAERGLVDRAKSPDDGRRVIVRLTERGRRVVDDALEDHVANEVEILSGLSERQFEQLVGLLRVLHRSVVDPA